MRLSCKIEAILFHKSEPLVIKKLAELLKVKDQDIADALLELEHSLHDRGIRLVTNDESVMLATSPGASELIAEVTKEELSHDLGKAGVETLAIVCYYGPISRAQIDYIRGVNSSFILRHLMIRGLVDRKPNPADLRSFLYEPTFDLLNYLGLSKLEDLPEFQQVQAEIATFLTAQEKKDE